MDFLISLQNVFLGLVGSASPEPERPGSGLGAVGGPGAGRLHLTLPHLHIRGNKFRNEIQSADLRLLGGAEDEEGQQEQQQSSQLHPSWFSLRRGVNRRNFSHYIYTRN